MKSNEQPSLYFSKPGENDPASAKKEEKSPYLKSVLAGGIGNTGRVVRMAISDRLAAIRYIQDSKWRHSFYRG